ncbi:MAG: type I pullulanase [Cellulosilyticaceae bacterium]
MSNTFVYSNLKNYSIEQIDALSLYNSSAFEEAFTYAEHDLGAVYHSLHTTFKVWAPLATTVTLNTYRSGAGNTLLATYPMTLGDKGVWGSTLDGDLHGTYYTYTLTNPTGTHEVVDIYAKAVGVNGKRGMVVDFNRTNPMHWEDDQYVITPSQVDAIIYELHVRDLSVSPTSGITHSGKYLAFTELDTKNPDGLTTGISHIKDLGVTHVHLLPVYDYNSVDEAHLEQNMFNWGYDPLNYNAPEGSYATNPHDGSLRIKEFKEMVQSLHAQGLGVIMDVVYNHTAETESSTFNQTVPHYYHRVRPDGTFNNGSDCGNEVASDRSMVRKMIVDSVVFWAKEYHIDGFRFDLMGILDVETMNTIRKELDQINPEILMYGEGWVASPILLPDEASAVKVNTPKLHPRIASFSDDMRDAIKGHVFYEKECGFVNGNPNFADSIKFGIVASVPHPQIAYGNINYSKAPWALEPTQCITYASAHDNLTLFDKFQISVPDASLAKLIQMNKMAATLVLTSQGVAFIHAGEELLRTKVNADGTFEHNSYKSPDEVNAFDWTRKTTHDDVFKYYQGLINLRKTHPAFRMPSTAAIVRHLYFLTMSHPNAVGYIIDGYKEDTWQTIGVFFNPNDTTLEVDLPAKEWCIVVDPHHAGTEKLGTITDGKLTLMPHTHYVLVDAESFHQS